MHSTDVVSPSFHPNRGKVVFRRRSVPVIRRKSGDDRDHLLNELLDVCLFFRRCRFRGLQIRRTEEPGLFSRLESDDGEQSRGRRSLRFRLESSVGARDGSRLWLRQRGRATEVDLERGIDFDCLDELGAGVDDVPNQPESVGNVGLEKRENVIDRRGVFERGKIGGHLSRVSVCIPPCPAAIISSSHIIAIGSGAEDPLSHGGRQTARP